MIERYSAALWSRFCQPQYAGQLDGESVWVGQAQTPGSRAVMEMSLRIQQGRVVDARFRAYGCTATIATADWFAEQAQGKPWNEVAAIPVENAVEALQLPAIKRHCALLAQDAIAHAVARYTETSETSP